jgi:hypothetical protein
MQSNYVQLRNAPPIRCAKIGLIDECANTQSE